MLFKKLLFVITFISIATTVSIAGYLFFAKQQPALAQVATEFYVDPDWAGVKSGTASQPWSTLDNLAFNAIEAALVSGDVAVYFSAREAGNDADEVTTTNLNFVNFTNPGANRLTIDGMSKYNTDDLSPVWSNYNGNSKFKFNGANITTGNVSSTTDNPKEYITIRGFKIYGQTGNQAIFLKDFSHGIVEHNYLTHNPGANTGPGLMLTYSHADDAQAQATRSANVIIRNNTIQDNYGEGIYVNGCKESTSCTLAMDDILIEGNTIIDAGSKGGEGDGIDIKNFDTNIIIRGNTIYYSADRGDMGCIVSHSIAIVENNFMYNCPTVGVRFGEWSIYNHKDIAMDGGSIRNNVIVGGNTAIGAQYGIRVITLNGGYDFRNTEIANNTIYGLAQANSVGIYIYEDNSAANLTGVIVNNNIISAINGTEFLATAGVLGIHDHNNYYDVSGNVYSYGGVNAICASLSGQESGSICSDPSFIFTSAPYAANNFNIQANSPVIDAGVYLAGFTADYIGTLRPQGSVWDIGAYEYIQASPPLKGDFNSDKKVNDLDFTSFKNAFKSIFNSIFDLNSDSAIDVKDLGVLMSGWLE